ncbi:MAG: hypothetical protein FD159_674 [Syntrophaceae bacterium]|nr:MAG: hypothetical protein FD159_674 [Syntrophaceae bacterium]
MSPFRKILFFGIIYLAMVILLEVAFRILPVQESMAWLPVNEGNPFRRFEPNRSFTWSKNWNLSLVNQLKSNNYGFISAIDYDSSSNIPLTAVIGDSFIEAAMVDQTGTAVAVLNTAFQGRRRFYSFAASGAQLSTYIAYAKYAKKAFRPDRYVFLLIGNDFDESLASYGVEPGVHYFVEDTEGGLTLKRVDYEVGLLKKVLRKSALFMYLNANLEVVPRLKTIWSRMTDTFPGRKPEYVGQTNARVDARCEADSKRAVDAFFKILEDSCGVPRKNILIGIDGMRPHLYNPEDLRKADGSYFSHMRKYVLFKARMLGHPVVDMQPVFEQDYAVNKLFFEYPQYDDGHWNERAHGLFARKIIESGFLD